MARVPIFVRPAAARRRLAPLDEAERRRHKLRNLLHSILLLGGMVVLLALLGYLLRAGRLRAARAVYKDPADRLIVAVARLLDAPMVTVDPQILAYGRLGHVQTIAD